MRISNLGLLFGALILSSPLTTKAKSILDLISNPIQVEANSCSSTENLSVEKKCVSELCKDTTFKSSTIQEEEIENYLENLPKKLTAEQVQEIEKYAKDRIKLYQDDLRKALNSLKEKVLASTEEEKSSLFSYFINNSCEISVDQSLPIENRIHVNCNKDAQIPAQLIESYKKNEFENHTTGSFYYDSYAAREEFPLVWKMNKNYREELLKKIPVEKHKNYLALIDQLDQEVKDFSNDPEQMKKMMDKANNIYWEMRSDIGRRSDQFKCNTDECKNYLIKEVTSKSLKNKIKNSIKILDDKTVQKQIIASIKVTYALHINEPSEQERKEYEAKIDNLKKLIVTNMAEFSSPENITIWKNELAKMKYSDSTADHRSLLEGTLEPIDNLEELLVLADASNSKDLVLNVAQKWLPYGLVSDALGGETYFYSAYSVRNPDQGLAIATHEIGHYLSFKMRELPFEMQQKILQARSCLRDRYNHFKEKFGKNAGYFYEEENFADEFANMISKGSLAHCSVFANKASDSSYLPIPLSDPNDDYQHPSDIWRLLNEALYREEPLPLSCQELVSRTDVHGVIHKKCL